MRQHSLLAKLAKVRLCGLWCLFYAGLLLPSCTGTKDLSVVNLSTLYDSSSRIYNPSFSVKHLTDTTSTISALLSNRHFLFIRQMDDRFSASMSIRYKLTESYENINQLIDSGSVTYNIQEEEKNLQKVYEIIIRLRKKSEMLLVLSIEDNQKHSAETYYITVDNSSPNSRQSFSFNLKDEHHRSFKNYISENDSIRIFFRDKAVNKLYVRVYQRNFALAPPPFSFDTKEDFDYRPDHSFIYDVNDTGYLRLSRGGFYHFMADTSGLDGLTIFVYPKSFPSIASPDQMLECIRYLTTRREFEEMKNNNDKKAAMDKFWLDLGGNTERTKYLIKKYYTRIRDANLYFTSYTEGWRTDRGMIYTIFGKPNSIYKNSKAESWIYGSPNNALSLNFFFTKVINPFTENDYQLSREPLFEGSWMRAIDVWRQGRVYNDN